MATQSPDLPQLQIIATDVSVDDYMDRFAKNGFDYVEGVVYKVAPSGLRHEDVRDHLHLLFQFYLDAKRIGRVRGEPYVTPQ